MSFLILPHVRTLLFSSVIVAWTAVSPNLLAFEIAGESNLASKLDQIMIERKPHDRLTKLADLGKKLSGDEIPHALAAATGFQQWRERTVFQEATLKHWAELAPAAAFDYIAKLPESRVKIEVIRFAAAKLAVQDPRLAAAASTRLPPGPSRIDATNVTAENWAKKDAAEALAWADSLPEGFSKESALDSILFVWVHDDPAAASTRVEKLTPGDKKNALLTNIAGDWAASDPQGAIKWANTLPEGEERQLALVNVAESWADHDPALAGEFAVGLPEGILRQQAAAAVAGQWGMQDPHQAARWVETLDSASEEEAAKRLIGFWATVDPQASGRWVGNMPEGRTRDSAVVIYVDTVAYWAPDLGAGLALTLVDPRVRSQKVEACVRRWVELDPAAAKQWLEIDHHPPDPISRRR